MSHNPFRKARDQQIELPTADAAIVAGLFDFREEARQEQATTQPPTTKSGKPKKRVVIKTPPRSPEETQRRYSFRGPDSPLPRTAGHALGGDEGYGDITAEDAELREAINNARRNSVGTTTLPVDPVASGGGGGGASESGDVLEQPAQSPDEAIPVIKARANPFAKTLATTEQKYGLLEDDKEATSASKPTFDIDMFKNILLNGATPPPRPKPATDTDETSEHRKSTAQDDFQHRFLSLDGPVKSALPEAPHLLEDESSSSDDSDDEAMELAPTATSTGPETVAFDDLKSSQPVLKTSDPTSSTALIEEKPLPALPSTEPRAAMPPPPPVARRQAHTTPSEGRRRSSSIMSRSSVQSDASSIAATPTNEKTRAPPPPPSRRAQPVKTPPAISPDSETTTASAARQSTAAPPAPAPRRAPSKAVRTTGSSSRQALSALNEHSSSIVPPRPPARRAGESNRSSIDGSAIRRSSGQDSRRTSNDLETPEAVRSQADLLSDLAALQREVDELRARAGPG